MVLVYHNNAWASQVHTATLDSGTDIALYGTQVIKDTDDVTNTDISRECCFCNNNFHIVCNDRVRHASHRA